VIKRWGLPEGVSALGVEDLRRRHSTLEFVKRGRLGSVNEIRVVNSRRQYPPSLAYSGGFSLRGLNPSEDDEIPEAGLSLPSSLVARRVVFERGADGRVLTQRAYNAADRLLYTLRYLSEPDVATFSAGPFARAVRESGITYLRFVLVEHGPEAGLDREILFLDSSGRPQRTRRKLRNSLYIQCARAARGRDEPELEPPTGGE